MRRRYWLDVGAGLVCATLLGVLVNVASAQQPGPPVDKGKRAVELSTERILAQKSDPTPETDNPKVEPGKVKWHANVETANRAAKQSGKPVLIFYMLGKLDERFCSTNARMARSVLFSRADLSAYLNNNFEPVWVSVRPVPVLRIDFGDGKVLTRTLHGDVLTTVCTPDGQVIDALPGLYTPEAYLDRLDQLRLMARTLKQVPPQNQHVALKTYHTNAAAALKANQAPQRFAEPLPVKPVGPGPAGGVGKSKIERPTERILAFSAPPTLALPPSNRVTVVGPAFAATGSVGPETPVGWTELVQDSERQENARRLQIHELLAKSGTVRSEKVLKPIFKDVLRADLDDPYLGLSKTLFENYPFAEEDQPR